MNKNDQNFLIQKIRTQYTEKEHTDLDELKKLDKKVKRPATVFAYVFGILGAIVMGSGMSLVMTDLAATLGLTAPMTSGIAIGVIGMVMVLVNYPIYKGILGSRRKKYADEIIALSDKIMNK
ncbi:MAG: dihydropteridine reductase [Clostridia bacterium]|nr:dihydropteridine reductase [Clostridia bacterium]